MWINVTNIRSLCESMLQTLELNVAIKTKRCLTIFTQLFPEATPRLNYQQPRAQYTITTQAIYLPSMF